MGHTGTAIIEVAQLRKRYGPTVAVDDVSFTVEDGEIFGLLGPNGAGKTTTVESIEGLRVPDGGTIRVFGLDPQADPAALRERMGVQLQQSALPPKLRVGEALALYASFYPHPDEPGRLLERLGMGGKSGAYFRSLSGGQKQRLSIALALIGRPSLAVLDELTTGLDPQARRDTWALVEEVRDGGVTILLVTHDMDEAQHLCDRVALVDAGRIVATDTPSGLAERASGGKRVRFRVSAPFDESLLTELPEVRSLTHNGQWWVATGEGELVNVIVLALDAKGVTARDVTTGSGELEDAFLALVGHGAAPAEEPGAAAGRPARERGPARGWRTAVLGRAAGGSGAPRSAFGRLLGSEWHLALRNPTGIVWGIGLPVLLLAIFGSLPATTVPVSAFGGLSFFAIYLPVLIALSLALLGLIGLPIPLTSYRELGVLRRMATTPVPPSWVLGAQLVLNLGILALATLVIVAGGALVFGAHLDVHVPGFVLALLLAAAALFALGLWVSAIARTQRAAGAIGGLLFYPLLFFAGVWVPQQSMPAPLRDISHLTCLGAAVQALESSLHGSFPATEPLLVMLAWAVVFGLLAVRFFRWE